MKTLLVAILLMFGLAGTTLAHETTRSFVTLDRNGADLTANLRIAYRDIEVAVWIDEDLDGQITWGETLRRVDAVANYVTSALDFDAGGPCAMTLNDAGTSENGGIAYLDLTFKGTCPDPETSLRVTSRLFAEFDPDHRLFLTATIGDAVTTTLLGTAEPSVDLLSQGHGASGGFVAYFKEGVRHLLEGTDHLVFLLVLLLPAVATRGNPRKAAASVLVAVTGFTVAHALTLTAAATSFLQPPTAPIEILIALSIVVTAIDNIRPFIPAPRTAVAAFFGLIHGFGFATALGALNLSGLGFATALLGFNLGIEVAQVALVLLVMPALYALNKGRLILQIGSLGAIVMGMYWVWQRLEF